MARGTFALACAVLVWSCGGDDQRTITVALTTDIVPFAEFDSVQIEAGGEDIIYLPRDTDVFLAGVLVAEFSAEPQAIPLTLVLGRRGNRIATHRVLVTGSSSVNVDVLVQRSCIAIECTESETCRGGECEPVPADTESIAPECTVASDCLDPVASCARAECTQGSCSYSPIAAACDSGEYCRPELGCTPATLNACVGGQASCGGDPNQCETDTRSSLDHCGGCGRACADGLSCSASRCTEPACEPGLATCGTTACATSIVDDPTHCGACEVTCDEGSVCSLGSCDDSGAPSCSLGVRDCVPGDSDACDTDTRQSAAHCGECGNACGSAQTCVGGACTDLECETGTADCNEDAADGCEVITAADETNCGECGVECPEGRSCQGGSCSALTCDAPTADCDADEANGCETDTATDLNNCGACDNLCIRANASATCVASSCEFECDEGLTECDDRCIDTSRDEDNCGACARRCTPGQRCEDNECFTPEVCDKADQDGDGEVDEGLLRSTSAMAPPLGVFDADQSQRSDTFGVLSTMSTVLRFHEYDPDANTHGSPVAIETLSEAAVCAGREGYHVFRLTPMGVRWTTINYDSLSIAPWVTLPSLPAFDELSRIDCDVVLGNTLSDPSYIAVAFSGAFIPSIQWTVYVVALPETTTSGLQWTSMETTLGVNSLRVVSTDDGFAVAYSAQYMSPVSTRSAVFLDAFALPPAMPIPSFSPSVRSRPVDEPESVAVGGVQLIYIPGAERGVVGYIEDGSSFFRIFDPTSSTLGAATLTDGLQLAQANEGATPSDATFGMLTRRPAGVVFERRLVMGNQRYGGPEDELILEGSSLGRLYGAEGRSATRLDGPRFYSMSNSRLIECRP